MKIIKILIVLTLAVFACTNVNAQNMVERLGEKAKNAVENAVGKKIEDAINKTVDKATSKQNKKETGNSGSDKGATKPDGAITETPDAVVNAVESDFVQGPVVLFEDNFSGEKLGEFPSKWDISDGDVQVAQIGDRKAPKFAGYGRIFPLMEKDQYSYLPDVFTLEWDIYISKQDDNTGWIHDFGVYLKSRDANTNTWDKLCASVHLTWAPIDAGRRIMWECMKPTEGSVGGQVEGNHTNIKPGGWNHFAISFNKRAFKLYVNGVRIANIPNMSAPRYVEFGYEHSADYPYCCISNVRIGQGAVELYERNASDLSAVEKSIQETGKFVTNNILFETGKATLKPESMADIIAVAEYMKKNPSVRFEVQGHCDNQGSDKVNDALSQQRAESIVAELVKLGVDEWNLRAVGKGSHEPVADNSTDEGRAKNRRVEFIKK